MLSPAEYCQFINNTLNNPSEIWTLSFNNQINNEQRFLLFAIFSFKENTAVEELLKNSFNARLEYEIETNGHTRTSNSYLNAIKILTNGFIVRRIFKTNNNKEVCQISYINPSLADFINNYLIYSGRANKFNLFFHLYRTI